MSYVVSQPGGLSVYANGLSLARVGLCGPGGGGGWTGCYDIG